jgi:hypothetical protein
MTTEVTVTAPRNAEAANLRSRPLHRTDQDRFLVSFGVKSVGLSIMLEQVASSPRTRGQSMRRQGEADRTSRAFRPVRHGQACDESSYRRTAFFQQLIRRDPDDIGSNRHVSRNELTSLLISPRCVTNRPALRPEPEVANYINTFQRLASRFHRGRQRQGQRLRRSFAVERHHVTSWLFGVERTRNGVHVSEHRGVFGHFLEHDEDIHLPQPPMFRRFVLREFAERRCARRRVHGVKAS